MDLTILALLFPSLAKRFILTLLADTNPVSLPAKNPLIMIKIIKAHERIIIVIIFPIADCLLLIAD